jgi:hypothetical protein
MTSQSSPEAPSLQKRAELLPPGGPLWEAPKERRYWDNVTAAKVSLDELEAFIAEVRAAYDAGVEPPFTISFPWISAATDYVNQSMSRGLSAEERKQVANARKFISEEQSRETALARCVSFLLNQDLTRKYQWGTLSVEKCAEVLIAISNRTFNSERYKFDILIPDERLYGRELYVTVALTLNQCRQMPYVSMNVEEPDLHRELRLYAVHHQELTSMPQWFLYSKALPALLDRFVFHEGADPASAELPINMLNWMVGLH